MAIDPLKLLLLKSEMKVMGQERSESLGSEEELAEDWSGEKTTSTSSRST